MESAEIQKMKDLYQENFHLMNSLREEVVFTLYDAIKSSGIKIDTIESRVKTLESLIVKCESKSIENPFTELNDLVAARVICLFQSSIDEIGILVGNIFTIIEKDDKVSQSNSFGYMSVHYICTLKKEYTGPRYDRLKGMKFEIQIRTLCMHAWAAVSHYLTYKSDWDIPDHLKKAFSALSGLFYVADGQFEQLSRARQTSFDNAVDQESEKDTLIPKSIEESKVPLNKDSLSAYLVTHFTDRKHSPESEISKLVSELRSAGYESIEAIDSDVSKVEKAFRAYEDERNEGNFSDVGVIRISIGLANEKYRSMKYNESYLQKYVKLVE